MTETVPGGPGDDDEVQGARRCSWCGRVEIGGVWVERARALDAEIEGHSVCPDCFESLVNQRPES